MDKRLEDIIEKKISEIFSKTEEISNITKSLEELSKNNDSFTFGLIVGRLYNSFYYQCRRILNRNPTEIEFNEFIQILKNKQKEFLEKTQ